MAMRQIKIILSLCLLFICAFGFAQTANDYRKAAEQGNAEAQYKLALCYLYGSGVAQDYSLTVYWCRQAVEQRNAHAQGLLGLPIDFGR